MKISLYAVRHRRSDAGTTRAAARTADGWRASLHRTCPRPVRPSSPLGAGCDADTPLGELLPGAAPLAPLPRPAKVICCGLNYGDHIRETGRDLPSHPTLFVKYADSLVGPVDDVSLPGRRRHRLGGRAGRGGRGDDPPGGPRTAAAAIAGYTVANDVSVRDWQYRTLQWFQGKAWDDSTPPARSS